jgi:hypothetical protein
MAPTLAPVRCPTPDALQIDPNVTHWVCDIHEDLAICGEELAGAEWDQESDPDEPPDCPLCVLADEQGIDCAIPGCPGRRGLIRSLIHRLSGGRRV